MNEEKFIYNMNLSDCAYTSIPKNKYHEDGLINEFLEYVRHTELESDAIYNIPKILKSYDRKKQYTLKQKLIILFN